MTAVYPRGRGTLGLRGSVPPLCWETSRSPDRVTGDQSIFEIAMPPGETAEVKLVRGDGTWAFGRNLVLVGGDDVKTHPCFDRQAGVVGAMERLPSSSALAYRVYVPPSYDEQDAARYPVVYAQDGQALWRDGTDPFGVWALEGILDGLFALGAMREIIVVGIDTSERRIERLSPVADRTHGGGEGPAHLDAIVEELKPAIDSRYRTRPKRDDTAVLGSSMGGLFSFFAAWTRPGVFGRAICLSSSFWWADRFTVRLVQAPTCPAPRPHLYLDSGASINPFADDADERDGIHHTQAMSRALLSHCFARGDDLHVLSFAGLRHDAASWAARVAVPLQLMFPRRT
ncbi:MAG: alpha/beta hydrolase-fold protein [Acidobacteriota bacterium]